MFSLHERTQRKVCRAVFLVACALPTALTVCWAVWFHRPWHEQDWRRSLENALHVKVEVDEISAPRPGDRTLQRLVVADLQSDQPLLVVSNLQTRPGNSFVAGQVTVYAGQLVALSQAVQVWLVNEGFEASRWQAGRLTFHGAHDATCELHDVRCDARFASPDVRQCTLQAKHSGKPVRLRIERERTGTIRATIDAQQVALPAWLVADVLPGAHRLHEAVFCGTLQLEQSATSLTGEFRGQLNNIDLTAWLGGDELQTIGRLQLDRLTWQDGRMQMIQGSLETGAGQVALTLLNALAEKLFCRIVTQNTSGGAPDGFRSFDKFGCRVSASADGVTISGLYPFDEERAVMVSDNKPVLLQPGYSGLPVALVVDAISKPSRFKIPATREATSLGEKLPLPTSETERK